jgi:hypothetical protein
MAVMSSGSKTMFTEDGLREELKAPLTIVSRPGTKRIGFMHEDCVWTTFHANPTNETDIEKLESYFLARTAPEIESLRLRLSQGVVDL